MFLLLLAEDRATYIPSVRAHTNLPTFIHNLSISRHDALELQDGDVRQIWLGVGSDCHPAV